MNKRIYPWFDAGFEVLFNPDVVTLAESLHVFGPSEKKLELGWFDEFRTLASIHFDDVEFADNVWHFLSLQQKLVSLRINGCRSLIYPDHDLVKLMRKLSSIDLSGSSVTDELLKCLSKLQALEDIALTGTKTTDVGVSAFKGNCKIRRLILCGTQVTDESAFVFESMTKLRHLSLEATHFSNIGVQRLVKCKQLTRLELQMSEIDHDAVEDLLRLENLEELTLTIPLPESAVATIAKFPKLKRLFVEGESTNEIRQFLGKLAPEIEVF